MHWSLILPLHRMVAHQTALQRVRLAKLPKFVKETLARFDGVDLGAWLPKGDQVGRAGSKAIDFYAFSWGIPALHQKSGQYADPPDNETFSASL
jgi:hypothetical protein